MGCSLDRANACSVSGHYLGPCGIGHVAGLRDQDHRKPGTTRLTHDRSGLSVCRVHPDPPDDDALRAERQRIGRSIRNTRMDSNLTQEQVFLAVPLNRAYYQQIESGVANPSLNTLLRIARVLGVRIADLLQS